MSTKEYLNDSSLKKEIEKILCNEDIHYLSFDIFDTLLRRDCVKPIDIFERIGHKALEEGLKIKCDPCGFMNSRIYFEKKARLATSHEDITLEEIYANSPYSKELQNRLIEIEKNLERDSLHADSIMTMLLEALEEYNKEIIVVSDMYHSKRFLKSVVESNFPKVRFKEFFVSSEIKLTKATGSIYPHVCSALQVNPNNILHIGDNRIADIERAQECGLHAVQFDLPPWLSIAFDRENHFATQYEWSINAARRTAALLAPKFETDEEAFAFCNGASIHGPALAGFAKWVLDRSNQLEIDKLLCVMREGELYKKVFKHFSQRNSPKLELFYASRKATFLPSIDPGKLVESLSSILNRKNYSFSDFLEDFELELEQNPETSKLYDKEVKELLNSEKGLEVIRAIVADKLSEINKLILTKSEAFKNYLKSKCDQEECCAFVDYGAGGTINLQIEKSTSKIFDHFLFTSSERAHNNADHIVFHSFLPFNDKTRGNLEVIHKTAEIFEYFHVGKSGTTLTYKQDGNEVRICTARPSNDPIQQGLINAFNLGVDYYCYFSNAWNLNEASEQSRLSAVSVFARQAELPTEVEAFILGALKHEDNFGSNNVLSVITQDEKDSVTDSNLYEVWANRYTFRTQANKKITWPSGLITLINKDFISTNVYHIQDKIRKHSKAAIFLCQEIKKKKYSKVAVYGSGEFFDELILHFKTEKIKVTHLIDTRANLGKYEKMGIKVMTPAEASDLGLPVVVASEAFATEICKNIAKHNITKTIISC
jgi:HAD superfamily hydrolase (TIGR01549 family)